MAVHRALRRGPRSVAPGVRSLEPTTRVLWPVVHLFGPHNLLMIQRLFTAIICLFSPYIMLAVMDSIGEFHSASLLLLFGAPRPGPPL